MSRTSSDFMRLIVSLGVCFGATVCVCVSVGECCVCASLMCRVLSGGVFCAIPAQSHLVGVAAIVKPRDIGRS